MGQRQSVDSRPVQPETVALADASAVTSSASDLDAVRRENSPTQGADKANFQTQVASISNRIAEQINQGGPDYVSLHGQDSTVVTGRMMNYVNDQGRTVQGIYVCVYNGALEPGDLNRNIGYILNQQGQLERVWRHGIPANDPRRYVSTGEVDAHNFGELLTKIGNKNDETLSSLPAITRRPQPETTLTQPNTPVERTPETTPQSIVERQPAPVNPSVPPATSLSEALERLGNPSFMITNMLNPEGRQTIQNTLRQAADFALQSGEVQLGMNIMEDMKAAELAAVQAGNTVSTRQEVQTVVNFMNNRQEVPPELRNAAQTARSYLPLLAEYNELVQRLNRSPETTTPQIPEQTPPRDNPNRTPSRNQGTGTSRQ